jgi:UDP-N-acetylglucosamine--N-acetylmuramyl-(pentapeptide) pyrophosphoryl-undecaprenol N-acetylglucosamine transferase
MKLLIAGGGTGGHVFPAIAIAREWLARASEGARRDVVLVGTKIGLEAKLVPPQGLPFETIRVAGLKGIGGMKLVQNLAMLPGSAWDSNRIVARHRFDAALGVGGYASGPMMLAAAVHRVPTVILEPNIEPGFTNRVLAPMVTRIATAFEETAKRWGAKAQVTGVPVRKEFFGIARREHKIPLTILITGGSRGATPINQGVMASLEKLAARKNELFIVHQTGERDYNAVRLAYANHAFHAEVIPFIENMAERFAQADLILCRAGAITVAEVAAAGRAAIFIPFAAATDAHQLRNAQALATAGAGRVLPQNELSPERLSSEIFEFLDQPAKLVEMEDRARGFAHPHAVAEIVDLLESVVRR